MSAEIDHTLPKARWKFDEDVARVFIDMLERSIPEYDEMRRLVFEVGSRFVQPETTVLDLGCSRGDALAPFLDKFGACNRFVGIEISQPMLKMARERFQGYINVDVVDIREMDLRREYPAVRASLTLAILTVQFIPIEYRQRILRDIYTHTTTGGALVLVEKVLGESAGLDSLMVDIYLNLKRTNGYSEEEIERKKLSLEGVLVPVTARWNEQLLTVAGFRQIDCFWRWMNFAGWIAVKE